MIQCHVAQNAATRYPARAVIAENTKDSGYGPVMAQGWHVSSHMTTYDARILSKLADQPELWTNLLTLARGAQTGQANFTAVPTPLDLCCRTHLLSS